MTTPATITRRRICWPNPDATCLNGGCVHCNGYPFRALTTIRRWAEKAGPVDQRCKATGESAIEAFRWGERRDFANAETR
jgi:hypothetical protein